MKNEDLDKLKPGDVIFDNKGGERKFWVASSVPGGNYVIQTQDGHIFPVTELHLIKPTSRNVPQYVHETAKQEKVNHPSHYGGDTAYEAIKVIEAWKLNFNLGNTVKYISRAGKKGDILEDLKKAAWYLQREIDNIEQEFKA